jgi:hypothetical protein
MPTFIDESGDTGHHADSASYFRLAAVWLPTQDAAEALRAAIQQLRRDLGLPPEYEFKFARSGTHPERRRGFFNVVLAHEFRFAVAAVNKVEGDWRAAGHRQIHWACAVSLAATLRGVYHAEEEARAAAGRNRPLGELVVVDDNQDREFLAVIREKFGELTSARHPRVPLVGKVKFRGSRPDELLQLADMVCGAVGTYLDGDETWYRLIASRDLGITRIP